MNSVINARVERMNSPAVWKRMLWKDGRELLPIWIILLLVTGLCLWITSEFVKTRFYDASAVHLCGQTFIAIFCIATGVFLFATETENRTIEFLRGLPVRPEKLVYCKLLLGLAAALLAACLIGFAANLLVDQLPTRRESFDSTRLSGVRILVLMPLLCFLFGVVAAMITRSTFYGFVLAGTMVFLFACFAETFLIDTPSRKPTSETNYWLTITATGLAILAIVIWKAESWVEGRLLPTRSRILPSPARVAVESVSKASRRKPFLFLLWQSFRMARIPLVIYLIVVLSAWLGLLFFFYLSTNLSYLDSLVVVPIYQAVLFSAAVLTLLLGTTVFMKDHQQRSYRFFQQNVECARRFWLARLLPWWLAIITSVLIINLWATWMFARSREHLGTMLEVQNPEFGFAQVMADLTLQYASQTMSISLLILLAALGVSQLFSMFVRNPVIAVVVALIVGIAVVAYGMVVAYLDESLIWFLVPIIIALYFATWFRSKYWLADSPAWIGWFVPVAAILLTTTAVLASLVHHRANEYSDVVFDMNNLAAGLGPRSNYRIDQLEFGTAACRRATTDLYRQAILSLDGDFFDDGVRYNLFDDSDEELDKFVATYQPAINLMVEAAEKIGCEPFLDYQKRFQQANSLKLLMAASTRKLIRDGQHEPALASLFAYDRLLQRTAMPNMGRAPYEEMDFYNQLIQWADLPDQDPQLIRSAISRIEGSRTNQIPTRLVKTSWGSAANEKDELTEQLEQHYGSIFRDLRGEQAVFELIYSLWEIEQGDNLYESDVSAFDQLLWEEQRTKRLLQRQVINKFSGSFQYGVFDNDTIMDVRDLASLAQSVEPYRIRFADQRTGPHRFGAGNVNIYLYLKRYREAMRRYALLRLALAAYRAEQGSYPDTLQALAGFFKKNLPKTVHNGRDFGWYPQGLPAKAFVGRPSHPRRVLNERINVPILLPFAVKQPLPTKELVSFHPLDDAGEPKEDSELGIELIPVGDFNAGFWSGSNFYPPPAKTLDNQQTPDGEFP